MFKRKTLFVVGAGASAEADFPCGDGLALNISGKLDFQIEGGRYRGGGDPGLFDLFKAVFKTDINPHLAGARLIRDGIHLTDSIDNFLDLHRENKPLTKVAKATIVKCILEAERNSKLWFDDSNVNNSIKFRDLHATWFAKFMKVLGKDMPRDRTSTIFDNVSFIVFNYDRCLEHFLHHAVRQLYGFTREEAASICAEVDISHPYGLVAPLAIETGQGVRFGDQDANCVELAANIKTFTEQTLDGNVIEEIRRKMLWAECIIFLGFAFHEPTMIMLKPGGAMNQVPVFSTGYGISDDDARSVQGAIVELFDRPGPSYMNFRQLKCADLFDNFSRTIAG